MHNSGHCKATEKVGDKKRDLEIDKCRQQVSSTAGGRWRWQCKTEPSKENMTVTYAPLGASSKRQVGQ